MEEDDEEGKRPNSVPEVFFLFFLFFDSLAVAGEWQIHIIYFLFLNVSSFSPNSVAPI